MVIALKLLRTTQEIFGPKPADILQYHLVKSYASHLNHRRREQRHGAPALQNGQKTEDG
jgi:hypothetical protein